MNLFLFTTDTLTIWHASLTMVNCVIEIRLTSISFYWLCNLFWSWKDQLYPFVFQLLRLIIPALISSMFFIQFSNSCTSVRENFKIQWQIDMQCWHHFKWPGILTSGLCKIYYWLEQWVTVRLDIPCT